MKQFLTQKKTAAASLRPAVLKNSLHSKLAPGPRHDPQEAEADRVAEQVMGAPAGPAAHAAAPCIRADAASARARAGAAPPSVGRVLADGGRPLDRGLEQDMGQRFNHDFSRVRVHADSAAAHSARDLNAHAYTSGHRIVFGANQFAPGTAQGRRLLAHELTHVVQQAGQPGIQLQAAGPPGPAAAGGLSKQMLAQVAATLRKAMKGWGTDEDAIYAALSGRTQEQVDAIAAAYLQAYGVDLYADLRDELTDKELEHLAIFSPTNAPGKQGSKQQTAAFADQVAHQLDQAMDRLGTDEEAIYAALGGRTQAQLHQITLAYKRLTRRELEDDLRDEMSGSELTHALDLLYQGEAVARLHLFTDIDVKDLGLGDVIRGDVGHTWVSLEYKDPAKVPSMTHPSHRPLLEAGGKYADPMGFWPATNEGIYYSVNPFKSYVKGWMRHPDRAHQGSEKATETWDIATPAVSRVIDYAESKRNARYSVYSYNCTDFAKEAVEAAGKRPPKMTTFGFAMPNAVYDGIKARQRKGVGNTSVIDMDKKSESVLDRPDPNALDKKD